MLSKMNVSKLNNKVFCHNPIKNHKQKEKWTFARVHNTSRAGLCSAWSLIRPKRDSATGTMAANFQPTRGEFLKITPWETSNHSFRSTKSKKHTFMEREISYQNRNRSTRVKNTLLWKGAFNLLTNGCFVHIVKTAFGSPCRPTEWVSLAKMIQLIPKHSTGRNKRVFTIDAKSVLLRTYNPLRFVCL